MERLRIIFLYLYFFSLSIENWSPWGGGRDLFRPTLIVATIYVVFSCLRFSRTFRIGNSGKILRPALFVWLWLTIASIIQVNSNPDAGFILNYTLLSCLITFVFISNDLSKYTFLKNHLLIVVLLNGLLLSVLSYLQIGIDVGHMGRQSLLGNNANLIGLSAAISLLVVVFIVVENPLRLPQLRYLLLSICPFLLQTMARTGSKGAFLILLLGFIVYFLGLRKALRFKIPFVIGGLIALAIAYHFMLQNEVFSVRWAQFLEDGDTTGRATRWRFAISVFFDNPILGVGENGLGHLASSTFGPYDPHNVYLYVLATGGLLAFIPFVLFLTRLFSRVFENKEIWDSFFPIALLSMLLLFWFKAGGGINSKLVWAYFALLAFTPIRSQKARRVGKE